MARSSEHGGFWAVSRYADVKAVAQDFRTYSSAETNALVRHDLPKMIPIDMDPLDQRRYRKVVSPRLAKERVGVIEPLATEHARNLLGAFASAGECDFVAQYAQPFPMVPIFSIIGIGQEDVMRIFGAADDAVRYRASDPSRAQAGAHAMLEFATNIAAEARENPLPDTLIGDLVSGVVKGEPLTNEEIARFILILLFGALDTTTNTLVFVANFLSDKPELRASLRSDPDLLHRSIEEFVRLASTVQGLTRLCTRDSRIGDQDIHEGERVLMLFAAANRDPVVFEDPHEFNADRNPHLHMGFGAGAHTCLGQHWARVMAHSISVSDAPRLLTFTETAVSRRAKGPNCWAVCARMKAPPKAVTSRSVNSNSTFGCRVFLFFKVHLRSESPGDPIFACRRRHHREFRRLSGILVRESRLYQRPVKIALDAGKHTEPVQSIDDCRSTQLILLNV